MHAPAGLEPQKRIAPREIRRHGKGEGCCGKLRTASTSCMRDALIVSAVRTPIGRAGGALASVRADDLAAVALRGAVARVQFDPARLADVILGCANQAGEDNRNVARMAVLLAGF